VTRHDLVLTRDISYGLLTALYLIFMCTLAFRVTSDLDRGSKHAVQVDAYIRLCILRQLDHETNQGRGDSPHFQSVLQTVENRLDQIISDPPLAANTAMSEAQKKTLARQCIATLRRDYGKLDPKHGVNANQLSKTPMSSLFDSLSRATGGSVRVTSAGSSRMI
jgi:hypothetical protein